MAEDLPCWPPKLLSLTAVTLGVIYVAMSAAPVAPLPNNRVIDPPHRRSVHIPGSPPLACRRRRGAASNFCWVTGRGRLDEGSKNADGNFNCTPSSGGYM